MLRVPGSDPTHPVALDAVQAAFLRVLQSDHRSLSQVENVRAWLTTTVRHIVLNLIRSGARQDALNLRLARDTSAAPQALSAPADDLAHLHRALDRLPDDARELLLLKHVAQLTLDQIAISLHENRNTIASRLRAAMDRLHDLLGAHPHAPSQAPSPARVGSTSRFGQVRP